MSPRTAHRINPLLFCGTTRTTPEAHDIVRSAMADSPMASGAISGGGPRYCPSIEDKVSRFGDRDGHNIFLEPEDLAGNRIYPNGISTSLPVDVQARMVAAIPGLEKACIVAPGYAVEYDFVDPRDLDGGLASRHLAGLFLAGQVNGTTGYEEAGAQGLVAGLSASALALDRAPIRFGRRGSYIGVLIDDLTVQGVTEPYRMLTARAEYRLLLRADNAETRLGPLAIASGCLDAREARRLSDRFQRKMELEQGGRGDIASVHDATLIAEIENDRRYAPYADREAQNVDRDFLACPIPSGFRYVDVAGLSHEMVERLSRVCPDSLDQASRIAGVTPAAITALAIATRPRSA